MLSSPMVDDLSAVASRRGLDRASLFAGVSRSLVESIPRSNNLCDQVFRDLHRMNLHGRLEDGTFPLVRWLRNARSLIGANDEDQRTFEDALRDLGQPVEVMEDERLVDRTPYPWGLDEAVDLHRTLVEACPDGPGAALVAQMAGVDVLSVNSNVSPREVWASILNVAALNRRVRALIGVVLKDPTVSAYHPRLRELLQAR